MLFSSLLFIYLFLPVTLILVFISGKKVGNYVLLAASLFFCAWGGISYAAVLIFSVFLNYLAGIIIEKTETPKFRRIFFITALILNLLLLLLFKYLNFFIDNIDLVSGFLKLGKIPEMKVILLPLGISFYTFKAITYLFSVHRMETKAEKNPLNIALYLSMFPQLAAGPIDRYNHLGPQISGRKMTFGLFAEGVKRFSIGFAKKVIFSTPLAYVADQVFAVPHGSLDMLTAWLGISCYTLQIYTDFSGYTDMAIGIGMMFGFRFSENFNFPYAARSVKEFWKRWHMTLSSWFRDYLFLPLAYSSSRKLEKNRYAGIKTEWIIYAFATMITFIICGLWHGAAWNFIVWGAIHGIFLSIEQTKFGKLLRKSWKPVQHLYLILFLVFSWVFFRAESLPKAFHFINVLIGNGISTDWNRFFGLFDKRLIFTLLIVIIFSSTLFEKISAFLKKLLISNNTEKLIYHSEQILVTMLIFIILITGTFILTSETLNSFIYFKF